MRDRSRLPVQNTRAIAKVASAGLVASICIISLNTIVVAQDAPATDCDTYAASDLDPQHKGPGVAFDKIDPALAVPACEAAVQRYPDNSGLIFQLGRAYHKANKFDAAAAQYRKAAELGNSFAQNNLASMYAKGEGMPQSYTEAMKWLIKAADQDNVVAQYGLAQMYANGVGVTQNYTEAVKWLRRAADGGYAEAQNTLAKLTGHLTAVQTAFLSLAEIKAKATPLTYDQMARTPSAFIGRIVKLRGKVTQVSETDTPEVQFRMEVTPDDYFWKDTVFVDYTRGSPSEPRILENDIVDFWGEYRGLISYDAALGQKVTLPAVLARAIEQAPPPSKAKN